MALLDFLTGILFIVGGGVMAGLLSVLFGPNILAFSAIFIVLGLVSLAIGCGLWTGKSWARLVELIRRVLGLLLSVPTLILGGFLFLE